MKIFYLFYGLITNDSLQRGNNKFHLYAKALRRTDFFRISTLNFCLQWIELSFYLSLRRKRFIFCLRTIQENTIKENNQGTNEFLVPQISFLLLWERLNMISTFFKSHIFQTPLAHVITSERSLCWMEENFLPLKDKKK